MEGFILTMRNLNYKYLFTYSKFLVTFYINYEEFKFYNCLLRSFYIFSFILTMRNLNVEIDTLIEKILKVLY